MKQILTQPFRRIVWQLLFLLCCYFISRCAFTLINIKSFEGLSFGNFLIISFYALRYDISAILVVNSLYIFLLLLPLPLWKLPRWEAFTQWLFIITNSIALLFEISDWAYFPYNFKRATADVLNMISRKGDFWSLLPRFIIDYWYVPIAAIAFIAGMIRVNNQIRSATPLFQARKYDWRIAIAQTFLLVVVSGLCILGIRGGVQYVPIGTRNAAMITEPRFTPIIINTPFSIINTFQNDELQPVDYFPENTLAHYFNTRKQFDNEVFTKKNVVLIIVESFSKEFTKLSGRQSYTPFIDSLMDRSLTCTSAYANALHSAEGIPAIVAGIPSLMDEPFSTSVYSNDRFTALPNMLKLQGYSTAFFHGGTNGTMSFDVFCAAAGYDKYYGRTEYNNENDYDGNWGIWDEPYLQYFSQNISKMPQPFFATVFTLSSHPPYNLPEGYTNAYIDDSLPVHRCIAYTDMAIRKFFETASKQPWFKNTLFIITADHCSPQSAYSYYQHNLGSYAIPIIYYTPDNSLKGYNNKLTQHIDILPTVLDYLGYNQPFFAYGNSIFRNDTEPFTINYISNYHQFLTNGYLLQTTNMKPTGLFSFPSDSLCQYNLLNELAPTLQLNQLKALQQIYNTSIINNKMWLKTK